MCYSPMKAAYLVSYGKPDSLRVGEMPEPDLQKDHVLVRVKAVSVNPVDWKTRKGMLKILIGSKFPMIIGADYSGVIEKVGPGVESFKSGDRVYGVIPAFSKDQGALAEIASVHQKHLRRMPDWLSFDVAASLPIAALTATNGLRRCGVSAGTKLLINGATGGVGHFAVQAAKAKGVHVTATCSESNSELAKELGADDVYDYSGENALPLKMQFDAILDAYGKMDRKQIPQLLKPGGTYASPLLIPWTKIQAMLARIRYGRKFTSDNLRNRPEDFDELEDMIQKKQLKPIIESMFPLEKASEAFDKAEFGKPRGKVIIHVLK